MAKSIASMPQEKSASPTSPSPTSKHNHLAARLSSLMPYGKKRKFSESSIGINHLFEEETYVPGDMSPEKPIERPILDNREKTMRVLCESFVHKDLFGNTISKRGYQWPRIMTCMELFSLSAYCACEFWSQLAECTESSHFINKKQLFLNCLDLWCSWDLLHSLKNALSLFRTIEDAIEHATEPVKFTARGCFWGDIILRALSTDICEFGNIFSLPSITDSLHQLDDSELQEVIDIIPLVMKYIQSSDARHLDRFLRQTVEKRGVLPSSIFLTGVRRVGSNFIYGGGFADVWKGEHVGKPVALKVLRIFVFKDREKMQLEFSKEALLWRKLDHPNVLPFLGICRDEFAPQMALVSQWMERGSLVQFLAQNPSANCLKLTIGVARGLEYLHSLKPQIIHGDLRAANVLVDENGEPRITDFGLAKAIDSKGTTITSFSGRGNLRWQPPELLHSTRFGEGSNKLSSKADVYAFACVCYEIFSGSVPFADLRDGAVIMEVAIQDKRPPWPGPLAAGRGLTIDIWNIMQLCWKTRPADRCSMPSVVSQLEYVDFASISGELP